MLRGRVPFEGRKTGALVNQICAAKVILTHLLVVVAYACCRWTLEQ